MYFFSLINNHSPNTLQNTFLTIYSFTNIVVHLMYQLTHEFKTHLKHLLGYEPYHLGVRDIEELTPELKKSLHVFFFKSSLKNKKYEIKKIYPRSRNRMSDLVSLYSHNE